MRHFAISIFGVLTALAIGFSAADDGKAPAASKRPDDSAGKSADAAAKAEPAKLKTIETSIGMKLVEIPAGSFVMGSDSGYEDEKPAHKVSLTKPFYMGITEVTQAQYEAVMSDNPSQQSGPSNLPVDTVSWEKANEFCKKLSELDGAKYRLPTEAEWEYACRSGGAGRWGLGDGGVEITDETIYEYAWLRLNSETTAPVATKKPNAWGLYDMNGNVFEWCQDRWLPYEKSPATDPLGVSKSKAKPRDDWPEGEWYVLRGGSWEWGLDNSNAAARCRCKKVLKSRTVGIRVVREM